MTFYRKFLLAATVAVFVWSGIRPHDYFTWMLEVFPAVIGGIILWITRRRFPFMQGFGPAIWMREILIRTSPLKKSRWLNPVVVAFVLAGSAVYEFVEWWMSLLSGSRGDAFLGTQGYVWDTQTDMFLALVGGILGLATLSRLHDAQIRRIKTDHSLIRAN